MELKSGNEGPGDTIKSGHRESLEEGQEGARAPSGGGSRNGEMRSHTLCGHRCPERLTPCQELLCLGHRACLAGSTGLLRVAACLCHSHSGSSVSSPAALFLPFAFASSRSCFDLHSRGSLLKINVSWMLLPMA